MLEIIDWSMENQFVLSKFGSGQITLDSLQSQAFLEESVQADC